MSHLDTEDSVLDQPEAVRGARTVFGDYASMMGARVGSVVLSLASVMMTTRILAPRAYGAVAYTTVISLLVFTICSGWTSAAVSRYGREQLERAGSMVAVTWNRAQLTLPLIGVSATVIVGLKLAGAFPDEFTWALVWIALAFGVVSIVAEHGIYLLEAYGRMKTSAAGAFLSKASVVVALVFIFASGTGQSAVVIAAIPIASSGLLMVAFAAMVWRVGFWPPAGDRDLRRRMLRFSVPLIAFTVSQYVIRSVDLVVIGSFGSVADVGVYAVAYQGYSVLQQVGAASGPVLTPLFVSLQAARREDVIRQFFERVIPMLTLVGATIAGCAIPVITLAVPVVFGSGYADAATPLAILVVASVLFFVANLLAPILVLYEESRRVGLVNVVAAVVNAVGDVVLVGPGNLGSSGAAIATVGALAVILVGYFTTARACVGSRASPRISFALPVAVGLGGSLVFSGAAGALFGLLLPALSAVLLVTLTRPFTYDDEELISRIGMPEPVKAFLMSAVRFAAR